ncbi:MAG: hypothetical protein HZB62_10800 [Nitrospirae bacterium]|nr:hypothetical protein [Nitrospirota bacterium]
MEVDGVEPDCIDGQCVIPELDDTGTRIFKIRSLLLSLQGVVDPGTILRMHDATLADIELLAMLEDEVKELKGSKDEQTG